MTTRPLTDHERSVLLHVLSVPFDGVVQLRAQAVLASASPAQGPSLDLVVPETAPPAPRADGPVPVAADVLDDRGDYMGELLVWVTGGRLSGLEYAWVTDEPPQSLPVLVSIRVAPGPELPQPR